MTSTKFIVTTCIGRVKKYAFGTGKTSGNLLMVEYSTLEADAEQFDTMIEAKAFVKQISNPFLRQFTIEPLSVKSFETMTLPVVTEEKLGKKAVVKKVK